MLDRCPFIIAFIAWVLSLAGTALALVLLKRFAVMDTPNARSNHTAPVVRGGGIAMITSILLCFAYIGIAPGILVAALFLAAVSFTDDLKNLPVRVRVLAQCVAVTIAMFALPGRIFPVWAPPFFLECILMGVAWLWFINLTNFMDGIDGITSMQTIMMGVGICLVSIVHPLPLWLTQSASVIAAAAFGFYAFNRSPAKLFMGDVGSITLGFLMGYLLLSLIIAGAWAAALILPAYYLSDATFTLLKRAKRREKVWQAHSQHAYQQAVRSGMSHASVVCQITMLNAVLVGLAMLSTLSMMAGLALLCIAYLLTACLIWRFTHVTTAK